MQSEITLTQHRTSPGDGTMGIPDPDYGGVGIGPGARHGFGRKLRKKNLNLSHLFLFARLANGVVTVW